MHDYVSKPFCLFKMCFLVLFCSLNDSLTDLSNSVSGISTNLTNYTLIDQTVGSTAENSIISGYSNFIVDAQSGFRILNHCHVEVRGHFTAAVSSATSLALFRVRGNNFIPRFPSQYAGFAVREWLGTDESNWTNTLATGSRWIESSGNYWVRSIVTNNISSGSYYSFVLNYIGT